jgi:hypothetical protein
VRKVATLKRTTAAPLGHRRDLAALAPSKTRRASAADRLRVRRFAEALASGTDEVEAFWRVASDPRTGYVRFRGATARPSEVTLRRKLAALLARTVPALVDQERDRALARLAGLSDSAIEAVSLVVRGKVTDAQVARARTDAARLILAGIGIEERKATATAAVSISFGDALRAMRHVTADVRDAS